jgi:4-hydroxybenzoate polyprenyltransferase
MSRASVLAFAQLLRIPNVFTAFADIALGGCAAAAVLPSAPTEFCLAYLVLALASGCLYLAGMVWNDVFDLAEDRKARAFRPLPSGRVKRGTAITLGVLLFAVGMGLAAAAGLPGQPEWNHEPLAYALGIVAGVMIYDGGAKRTPAGPLAMGGCRFLNILFGLSLIPEAALDIEYRIHLAAVVGFYIVGVTWFARTEEGKSRKRDLAFAASIIGLSLILALLLRVKLHLGTGPTKLLATLGTFWFPYLLVAFGFLVGRPIARAISDPSSRAVQAAVKRCVLGLVVLDAVLATMFVGLPGLLLLLLLPPALVLGKWVYST